MVTLNLSRCPDLPALIKPSHALDKYAKELLTVNSILTQEDIDYRVKFLVCIIEHYSADKIMIQGDTHQPLLLELGRVLQENGIEIVLMAS